MRACYPHPLCFVLRTRNRVPPLKGEAIEHTLLFTRCIRTSGMRKNTQTAGRLRLLIQGMCAALRPPRAEICCLEGLFSKPFRPSIELAHGLLKPLRDPNRPSRRQELDTPASRYRCFSASAILPLAQRTSHHRQKALRCCHPPEPTAISDRRLRWMAVGQG